MREGPNNVLFRAALRLRTPDGTSKPPTTRPAVGKQLAAVRWRIEWLENRQLLSLTIPGYATPDYMAYVASNSVSPLSRAGPTGYTPAQIRQAYGFNQITFNNGTVTGDGSGTTIAIVDAYDDPKIANDLHQFDLQFGLSDPTLTKVNETGGTALPAANAGWITEIALDVEWAHAIAPGANILLVEANSASYSDLFTAVKYAADAPGVVAVSMSWGGSEFSSESSYDSYFTTPSGHGGVTFVAASGDSGSPVSYPAISPNVLSVGGTTLDLNSQGGYGSETGWSDSGGGISAYESQPSYQKRVVTQSTTHRTNPDVAYDADPNTGFPVYDSYNNPASSPWGQWGGTSDAAPQWAALIAIADQGRALAGKAALDGATQTLPMLYAMPSSDFHDITSGRSVGHPKYSASVGYDLVTGRGTPYANLVVADLVGSSTTSTVTLSPATLPADTVNVAYSQTITAGGGTGNKTLTVSNVQNAIAGLVVPTSGTNTLNITGTPTATGTETFTVTATDSLGDTATINYSITVNGTVTGPVISSIVVATTASTPVITWNVADSEHHDLDHHGRRQGPTGRRTVWQQHQCELCGHAGYALFWQPHLRDHRH